MRSVLFRSSACAIVVLLAACDNSGGTSAEDTTAGFTTAADALVATLQAGAPAASDPAVVAFEAEADKALRTLGTPALPLNGFDSYDALCGKTATIVSAYVNLGVDQLPEASKAEAMVRNVTQYLDQMFTPLLFSTHCTAAHLPFVEEETVDDVSGQAAALLQIRGGAHQQVTGLLQMAGDPILDAARRRRIVDLLGADAASFAIILSLAQRQELAAMVDTVKASLPDADQAAADAVKAELTAAPCGPLCQM